LRAKFAGTGEATPHRGQAMVDKITAQRDVEYFYELLAKETDENKRVILQRLLAEAEKLRQSDDQEEKGDKNTKADQDNSKDG
jgi:hypothetical protein